MKILRLIQKWYTLLGISPVDDQNVNPKRQHLYHAFGAILLILVVLELAASFSFVVKFIDIDLLTALDSAFLTNALICNIIILIETTIFRKNVVSTFRKFQQCYDQSEIGSTRDFFERANRLSQKVSKFLMIDFIVFFVGQMMVAAMVNALQSYMTNGYVSVDDLSVPFPFILPWNQQTIYGWVATIVFCMLTCATVFFIFSTNIALFIAIAVYFYACYQHFEVQMKELHQHSIGRSMQERRINSKTKLRQAIQYHIYVKSVFMDAAPIFSKQTFFLLTAVILTMATALYRIAVVLEHLIDVLIAIANLMHCTSNAFTFCYGGEFTRNLFLKYSDCIYESLWYELPVESQKYITMMIANSRRPMIYNGLKIIPLNLEIFAKIVETAVTYYLAIQTLGS